MASNRAGRRVCQLNVSHFSRPQMKKKSVVGRKGKTSFSGKVLEALHHYSHTSSLHGLKYIAENRFTKFERVFWLIAFLVAVVFAFYFISILYIDYDQSPVIVGFSPEMMSVQDMPFPAITICNTNIVMKTRAERIRRLGSATDQWILDDFCRFNTSNYDNPGVIQWNIMEKLLRNVTQLCTEMMVGCEWQGKRYICLDLINTAMTDEGYCCSFNKLAPHYVYREELPAFDLDFPNDTFDWIPETGYPPHVSSKVYPRRAFGRGRNQGLTLVVDAALNEYYCSSTNSFGFKVTFHSPMESPKMAEVGFLIHPGVETRVSIDANIAQSTDSIRSIHYKKRQCFFSDEKYLKYYKRYSVRNCLQECEANFTLKSCGCTPFYLPMDFRSIVCDKSNDECTSKARSIIEHFGEETAACECLPGCAQISYSPGIKSKAILMDYNNISFNKYLGNYSQEYFAENMAIIHIYFADDRFQVEVKTPMYSFTEFLSNTGSILCLFLGFSFLSIVEIIYFLCIRGTCAWYQSKEDDNRKQRVFLH